MIPKKIHYCWFGGNPLPELAQKCIESWRKFCPDYEIIEWNETNFDINYNQYVSEAYNAKKWAFVSDVARLYALVYHGGIYMDTDVEVLKPLDDLLYLEAISGFEALDRIPTGLMACQRGQTLFNELLLDYDKAHFIKENGTYDTTTNVTRITTTCLKYGLQLNNTLQTINGLTLFPSEYFCPKDSNSGKITLTENTYTIHHFDGSWLSEETKYAKKINQKFEKLMPESSVGAYIANFLAAVKFRGVFKGIDEVLSWIRRRKKL